MGHDPAYGVIVFFSFAIALPATMYNRQLYVRLFHTDVSSYYSVDKNSKTTQADSRWDFLLLFIRTCNKEPVHVRG